MEKAANESGPSARDIAREDRQLKETGRVEAFSDGVFAIAATLLVLTLAVPAVQRTYTASALGHALLAQWPTYVAFTVSFITILVMWASHHNIFSLIHRVDHEFLLLNGLILLGVTAIPFPTRLVAQHLGEPSESVAAATYSAVALFIALAFNGLWYWARHDRRLLAETTTDAQVRAVSRQYMVAPLVYLLALALSFWNAWAAMGVFVLVTVYYAIPSRATAPLDD
jgi:uncharacterized membrane protein